MRKSLKNLFWIVPALLLAACSDDNDGLKPEYDVISFETSEHMVDIPGNTDVVLGNVAMNLYDIGDYTYMNIFCGKAYAVSDGGFDGALFSTAGRKLTFNSYYAKGFDMWGGIALAQLPDMKPAAVTYAQQFSVWAKGGAENTKTYAVCFDANTTSGDPQYHTKSGYPTIDFAESRIVDHLYIANSTLVYNYFTSKEDGLFQVKITGWNAKRETGSVTETLISGKTKLSGWRKVELAKLGAVDKLVMTVEGINIAADPAFFCIDEIALQK